MAFKMSGILRFFKLLKESELTPKSRELASKEVKKCKWRIATQGMKRGCYDFFSPENKAKVARYASENCVTASLHHFKQTGEFNNLKESTVGGWFKQYQSELQPAAGKSSTGAACVKKLFEKKWGRPLLLYHKQKFAKKLSWLWSNPRKMWKFFTTNIKQYTVVWVFSHCLVYC